MRRNAFGSQVDSAEVDLATTEGPVRVAFIRAPAVVGTGPGVRILAHREGAVVAVRQGAITGVSFHPELTGEPLFHRRLIADSSLDGPDRFATGAAVWSPSPRRPAPAP